MDGIGTVFGVIALFVSLAALWFVNDVIKRVERHNQQFVETQLRAVREALDACSAKVAGLERKAGGMAGQLGDLQKRTEELGGLQGDHQGRLAALREDVERLDKALSAPHRPGPGRRAD